MPSATNAPDSPEDQALARRLARLGSLPVDTTRLEKILRAQLPAPPRTGRVWLRRGMAIAASLLLLATLLVGLLQERPVQASPALLAQVHQDLLAGKITTFHTTSLAAANAAIAERYRHFPKLPEMPSGCGMACCCMKQIQNKDVACLLLDNQGSPVTVVLAARRAMCAPDCPTIQTNGCSYHVQSVGNLHVVMTTRGDCWISAVGQRPAQELIALLTQLKF